MVEWFQKILDKDWEIKPAGGLTGEAFFAEKDDKRLFLKRNSSPFLAVLSAEGIVPKLVWTKRMDNGDVITAQEWLLGRKLTPKEMQHLGVADLLHKIHHSTELLHMLLRLGKKPITADEHFNEIKIRLDKNHWINENIEVARAFNYLNKLLPFARSDQQVVCHGDIDHHNLLLTDDNQLYLIDWDNAMIADPITDYGMVLSRYVPKEKWDDWLEYYGIKDRNQHLSKRLYYYLLLDTLKFTAWYYEKGNSKQVNKRIHLLEKVNGQINQLF